VTLEGKTCKVDTKSGAATV